MTDSRTRTEKYTKGAWNLCNVQKLWKSIKETFNSCWIETQTKTEKLWVSEWIMMIMSHSIKESDSIGVYTNINNCDNKKGINIF